MSENIKQRLEDTPRSPRNLNPRNFDWTPNQNGVRSRVARLRADVAHKILGRSDDKPLEVAIPAYENAGTTNGSADDTESFSVSNAIVDSPNTSPIVVWLDGDYYGEPENLDLEAGSFDVTDTGTDSTVHAFYIPQKSGTLEFEKAVEGSTSKAQNLKTLSLRNVHRQNLSENEEYFEFNGDQDFEEFIAGDMTLDVYVDAPFIVRYEDPDGDGAVATNALLNFSTYQAHRTVSGFKSAVTGEM